MLHNWYAVSAPGGTYEATYKVYFGDASGMLLDGYGSARPTLTWNAAPAPGAAMTLALGRAARLASPSFVNASKSETVRRFCAASSRTQNEG